MNLLVEKRSNKDRRSKGFGKFYWLLKPGTRRRIRRKTDRRKFHLLDYYSPKLLYFLVAVLLLSLTDAFLTLWLIDHGAVELNPVMAYYLKKGPEIFIAIKYYLTATVAVITVLINYFFIKSFKFRFGHMLKVFSGCFALVVVWELFLIARLLI